MKKSKDYKGVAVLVIFFFIVVMYFLEAGIPQQVIGNMPFHISASSFTCPSSYWGQEVGTCNARITLPDPQLIAASLKSGTGSYDIEVMVGYSIKQTKDLSTVTFSRWDSNWVVLNAGQEIYLQDANGNSRDFGGSEVIVEYISKEASCTPQWITESWQACRSDNVQYRNVFDTNNCGTTNGKPSTSQSCSYVAPTPSQPTTPSVPTCVPEWKAVSDWSECANGVQTRNLNDGCNNNKAESQVCTITPSEDGGLGTTTLPPLPNEEDFVSKYKYWIVGVILGIALWASCLIYVLAGKKKK